jgi:hypothetical protein
MKKLKKNLFRLGLFFSLMLGVGFSFVSQNAEAQKRGYGELMSNPSGTSYCCVGSFKSNCQSGPCHVSNAPGN